MNIDFEAYKEGGQESAFLFHYTTRKVALRYILVEGRLKFSTRKKSHDPLEKEAVAFTAQTMTMADPGLVQEDLEYRLRFGTLINQARNHTKYACFSVDKSPIAHNPWNKGCFRSRMWSQYAESHKGICLVFDKKKLLTEVKKHLRPFPGHFLLSGKIAYANKVQGMAEAAHFTPGRALDSPVSFLKENAQSFLFSKIKDYEQEQEFRVAFYNSLRGPDLVSIEDSLAGIVVGQYCDDASFDEISQMAKRLRVPVATAFWFRGQPSFAGRS